eukprot:4457711-Pleurochrysis_carterae.AAC.5
MIESSTSHDNFGGALKTSAGLHILNHATRSSRYERGTSNFGLKTRRKRCDSWMGSILSAAPRVKPQGS